MFQPNWLATAKEWRWFIGMQQLSLSWILWIFLSFTVISKSIRQNVSTSQSWNIPFLVLYILCHEITITICVRLCDHLLQARIYTAGRMLFICYRYCVGLKQLLTIYKCLHLFHIRIFRELRCTQAYAIKSGSDHSWWHHQMETFSALQVICAGNSPVPGRGALMISLICVVTNGCVNNREAGDLRRYRDHYDVTVMFSW